MGDNVRAAEIFRDLVVVLWVRDCLMHWIIFIKCLKSSISTDC